MKNKCMRAQPKAVILLSGGLDSATTLYYAKDKGFLCTCLSFDYGQRHRRELAAAKRIASAAECEHFVVKIALPWKGSSLLDRSIRLPVFDRCQKTKQDVPNTYVPARNIIFLSFALSCAEAISAKSIFIGANAIDYSGYPDCRPEFYTAFQNVVRTGTKSGKNEPIRIMIPLINMAKADIVKLGSKLQVPYGLTWSCYAGGSVACGSCDSCHFRAKGFQQAGIDDPAVQRRNT